MIVLEKRNIRYIDVTLYRYLPMFLEILSNVEKLKNRNVLLISKAKGKLLFI